MSYDSDGNLVELIEPGGSTYSATYDASGNITSLTDPLGLTTKYTFDSSNNLTSYTDPKGNTTQYAYNSNSDLLSITYANGAVQQSSYNPLGEAQQYIDERGQAIGLTYNAQGLLTGETFSDGTSYSFIYDDRDNLTEATDAQGNVTKFGYGGDPDNPNNPDLLTEVEYPDGTYLKFSYYPGGLRKASIDQTGFIINYTYDSVGDLTELTDGNGNLIVKYTYNAYQRLTQKDNGNGTRTVYTYDANGDVLSITNYAPDHVTINSFDDYTYDPLGNVLSDTNQDGEWMYTYDADSQLTHAVFTPNETDPDGLSPENLEYAYDAAGNRISESANGVVTTYNVNNVNEYISSTTAGVGTTAYQYDLDGNLTSTTDPSGNTTDYSYNELDELTGVSGPGASASYTYDPFGDLVSQTLDGATTNFQVDPTGFGNIGGGTVVAAFGGSGVYNNSGGLEAHYISGLGLTSQVSAAGTASYYDFGLTGNTVGITGASGTYVNRYGYLPFGETTTIAAALSNTFTFAGEFGGMNDGSGLVLLGVRSYDVSLAQFTSTDPLGLAGGTTNTRLFVDNNPVALIDPTGLDGTNASSATGDTNGANAGTAVGKANGAVNSVKNGYEQGVTLQNIDTIGTAAEHRPPQPSPSPSPPSPPGSDSGDEPDPDPYPHHSPPPWYHWYNRWFKYEPAYNKAVKQWNQRHGGTNPPSQSGTGGSGGIGPVSGVILITPGAVNVLAGYLNGVLAGAEGIYNAVVAFFHDPNDLIGPSGYGSENFVPSQALLPYRIDFENQPTATAPVQDASVTDQLDPNLDWGTFALTEIGFGNTILSIPAGSQHFAATVPMTENGETFDVDIDAGINLVTGQVYATFQSINPATGLPPDVLTGFVPPEDGTGRGTGHISFTIEPNPNLPTGTQIRNVGIVTFDPNAPIATDQVDDDDPSQGIDPTKEALITIDSGPPNSSVTALPVLSAASFTVNWSGQDDAGGSGIAFYDIYASENGGPYTLWQSETTQTSATYTGLPGQTYSFYSVATDNVGNVEATPSGAQATTTVIPPVNVQVASSEPESQYGQSLTFTATLSVSPEGIPTPGGTVQFEAGGVPFGAPVTVVDGQAESPSITTLAAGDDAITALYSGDSNYAMNTGSTSQTVSPAPLTVTALAESMTYGGAVPTLEYAISGFTNAETASVVSGAPTITTTATPASPVAGSPYAITIGAGTLSAANYTFATFVNGPLTVMPAMLSVTAASESMVYGGTMPALSYKITGFVNGDTASVVSSAPVIATSASSSSPVTGSPFAITVSTGTLSASNYSFAPVNGALRVTPAPLLITAVSTTMVAGQAVPALSASYRGFQNGDTAASLTVQPVLSTTGTPASPAGSYPITASGATSPNYMITYVQGTLTITPPPTPPATLQKVSIQKIKTGKHKTTEVIVLQFSEALNAADAQNLAAYSLATVAKSKKQKSKPVALAEASYSAAAFTVTLTPRKALVLNPPLQLTLQAASLLDALGRPMNNGVNLVAMLSKSGATVTSDVSLARTSGLAAHAVDAVIEREATLGSRRPALARLSSHTNSGHSREPGDSFITPRWRPFHSSL